MVRAPCAAVGAWLRARRRRAAHPLRAFCNTPPGGSCVAEDTSVSWGAYTSEGSQGYRRMYRH